MKSSIYKLSSKLRLLQQEHNYLYTKVCVLKIAMYMCPLSYSGMETIRYYCVAAQGLKSFSIVMVTGPKANR